ncbi:amidohydrolase family protein [uncultured Alistipes sp.]|uniref:amidohydrolase family protein n=1 Tax=uncultured Alistipes sp. TaxID=538949 RepID=UPI002632E5F4|nr:amidohydrolase family protein [uncultured Alistipes sp.]
MSTFQSLRRIASNYLFTGSDVIVRPLVASAPDGRILSIEQYDQADRLPGVEFYAGLLAPGMVNAHCHLELSCLRGAIPEGGGFTAFARAMGEVRSRFEPAQREAAIDGADARMWVDGIQAVGDVSNGEESFPIKARSRLSYRTFAEVFGLKRHSAKAQLPLLDNPRTSLTPHAVYSVQDALFRSLCAEGEAPLSIHFMESPVESELFQQRGELWEWYAQTGLTCDFLHYGSPARRIVESIPSDRSVILVHDCCVTQQDIDLIMEHFTAPVWWCLCPCSNHYISRLRPPVELLRRNGLRICLGTDSLASNTSLSLLEEIRQLPEVPLLESLEWATRNGAKALGLEEVGEVAVGKRPGLILFSGLDYRTMSLMRDSRLTRIS